MSRAAALIQVLLFSSQTLAACRANALALQRVGEHEGPEDGELPPALARFRCGDLREPSVRALEAVAAQLERRVERQAAPPGPGVLALGALVARLRTAGAQLAADTRLVQLGEAEGERWLACSGRAWPAPEAWLAEVLLRAEHPDLCISFRSGRARYSFSIDSSKVDADARRLVSLANETVRRVDALSG